MFTKDTIDFNSLDEQGLKDKLKEYKLALTPEEALKVQNEILKRPLLLLSVFYGLFKGQSTVHTNHLDNF